VSVFQLRAQILAQERSEVHACLESLLKQVELHALTGRVTLLEQQTKDSADAALALAESKFAELRESAAAEAQRLREELAAQALQAAEHAAANTEEQARLKALLEEAEAVAAAHGQHLESLQGKLEKLVEWRGERVDPEVKEMQASTAELLAWRQEQDELRAADAAAAAEKEAARLSEEAKLLADLAASQADALAPITSELEQLRADIAQRVAAEKARLAEASERDDMASHDKWATLEPAAPEPLPEPMAPMRLAEQIQRDLESLRDSTEATVETSTKKWQAALTEESANRTCAVETVAKATEELVAAEATSRGVLEQRVVEAAAHVQSLQVNQNFR